MRFKYKFFLLVLTLAAIYLFRYEILDHFGMEDALPPRSETAIPAVSLQSGGGTDEAPEPFPAYAAINQSGSKIYRQPGRGVIAQGKAGDRVSVLDSQDTGQKYINVRYNGIAGFINRGQLNLK